jgi:hypothetical protein
MALSYASISRSSYHRLAIARRITDGVRHGGGHMRAATMNPAAAAPREETRQATPQNSVDVHRTTSRLFLEISGEASRKGRL